MDVDNVQKAKKKEEKIVFNGFIYMVDV